MKNIHLYMYVHGEDTIAPNMEFQGLQRAACKTAATMRNGPVKLTIQRG